jgi:tight adherence protein C
VGPQWAAILFAGLAGLAVLLAWMAFAPARPQEQVDERLDELVDRRKALEAAAMSQPFVKRVVGPALRSLLRALALLAPRRNVERAQRMLLYAGSPGGLTALDYFGIQILLALVLGVGYFLLLGRNVGILIALRNTGLALLLGYLLPAYWLRARARGRQHQIRRALPDALDMLTVGVEAGLAFESAMLRVAERWENALTQEFRRAVTEMRIGTSREEALWRMVERAGVEELRTFVAILNQSSQLGVSIAEVLHSQAAQMRIRRRQRAEELARQAGVKLIFPLGLFIFPALLIVILGPAIPIIGSLFGTLGGSGGLP